MHQEFAILAERGIGGYYGLIGAGLGAVIALAWFLIKSGGKQEQK